MACKLNVRSKKRSGVLVAIGYEEYVDEQNKAKQSKKA